MRVVLLLMVGAVASWAQEGPTLPPDIQMKLDAAKKKAEQEQVEGAGTNSGKQAVKKTPAPKREPQSWNELVEEMRRPISVPKKNIVRIDETHAYPNPAVNIKMEIVREEGNQIWLRGLPPEDPDSVLHELWLRRQVGAVERIESKKFEKLYGFGDELDFEAPIVPPPTIDAVNFSEVPGALPKGGRWQMGFDVADMNADGNLDLVFPPTRKGSPHPWIFLGDGHGGFSNWDEVKWNPQVPYDYGDLKVADFDGDGFLDIVLAIHFKSQYVLYGSANHEFQRFRKLPSPDPRLSSRAVTVGDFNKDGRMDCAFEAEINLDMNKKELIRRPTIWIVSNTADGWKAPKEGVVSFVFGDKIQAGDFNNDGLTDLAFASNFSGWRDMMELQQPDGGWRSWNQRHVYRDSYQYDVEPYRDSNGVWKLYGVVVQFKQVKGKTEKRSAVVRYRPGEGNDWWADVTPELIYMYDPGGDYYFRVEVGDLNGDGLEDLVLSRNKGGLEVWLQTKNGEFYRNLENGLNTGAKVFSVRIMDVNGDGYGDIIAGTVDQKGSPGGIRIWLTHPKE